MAIGAAIFSGVMSMAAAAKQRKAGKKAQSAAEEGARGIEAETEMNIGQTKQAQAQTLGLAKSNIAASGVRFDASKIGAVKFTEEATTTKALWSGNFGYTPPTEIEAGEQIAGETEGDSIFTYMKEMKRTFAKDIAWQGEEGRSRARVTRMGGQVAKAQAYAGAMASVGQAVGSFGSAYSGAKANVAAGKSWYS